MPDRTVYFYVKVKVTAGRPGEGAGSTYDLP